MDRDWNAVRFEPGSRGHVESYFFKLNDPAGNRALWLKATILARLDGSPPVAEAWAIAFERGVEAVGASGVGGRSPDMEEGMPYVIVPVQR